MLLIRNISSYYIEGSISAVKINNLEMLQAICKSLAAPNTIANITMPMQNSLHPYQGIVGYC